MKHQLIACALFGCLIYPHARATAEAESVESEIRKLRESQAATEEKLRKLESLINKRQSSEVLPPSPVSPDNALLNPGRLLGTGPVVSGTQSASSLRLTDLSLAPVFAAGWSSAPDSEIESLQGGGHDPKRRGFTLQQAELSLGGAVDPYFNAESHFVFLEGEGVETEEVFLTTRRLPAQLELKAGYFLTEFGRMNPTHAHAWDWVDSPVINTRLLGADGMRGSGLRLSGLLPTPWFSELKLGMQQADGDNMTSFRGSGHSHSSTVTEETAATESHEHHEHEDAEEHEHETAAGFLHSHAEESEAEAAETVGGYPVANTQTDDLSDFVYLARWDNFLDLSDEFGLKFGLSGVIGPNSTGSDAQTAIYGADLLVRWLPVNNFRGYPYITFQSEIMKRDYDVDDFSLEDQTGTVTTHDGLTLNDWGYYCQLLYGFTYGWSAGLRTEYASGSGTALDEREHDPSRADRFRLSPLLSWRLTEFSRVRLQYNYDQADHTEDQTNSSVWIGLDALIGTHPSHGY